jgi:tetratricopeptide (TPR) repeat protein
LPDDVSAINSDLLGDLATSCKDTNINDMPVDAALNIAKACLKEGRTEEGNKIIKQIVRNHHDDQTILDKVAQLYKELGLQKEGGKIISDTKSETIEINNKGVQLLKKGKYQESIELFLKAVESMPQNYIINLNAAYSLILFMKDKGVDKQKMQKAKSYLDVAQSSEPHKSKYDEIMTMYNQMSA